MLAAQGMVDAYFQGRMPIEHLHTSPLSINKLSFIRAADGSVSEFARLKEHLSRNCCASANLGLWLGLNLKPVPSLGNAAGGQYMTVV